MSLFPVDNRGGSHINHQRKRKVFAFQSVPYYPIVGKIVRYQRHKKQSTNYIWPDKRILMRTAPDFNVTAAPNGLI